MVIIGGTTIYFPTSSPPFLCCLICFVYANSCPFLVSLPIPPASPHLPFAPVWQRVKSLTQNVKYNDPLREYVDIIVKKFPAEIRAQFSKGHDDFEDYVPSQDMLTKGSLESLYKNVTTAVRLSHSTNV